MFESPKDLAEGAFALLQLAANASAADDEKNCYRLELAAAALAVHVADWHMVKLGIGGNRNNLFDAFSSEYPILRSIVNGLKHADKTPGIGNFEQREAEWEEADAWLSAGVKHTLQVDVEGDMRSVRAMVVQFCEDYLREGAGIGATP